MKTIYLSNGKGILVDDIDYDLSGFNWHQHNHGYAYRNTRKEDGTRTTIYMHREIAQRMGIEGNIDHINRLRNDNRRKNLRGANHQENGQNASLNRNNKSGYPGVDQLPSGRRRARITQEGVQYHLGYFDTYEEAVAARRAGELKYWGHYWEEK